MKTIQYFLIVVGLILLVSTARAQYAGTYAGTYSGGESGTWRVTISDSLGASGYIVDPYGDMYYGTGSVDGSGGVIMGFVSAGASFQGQITAAGRMSGTWSNPDFGISGSFSGQRLNPTITTTSPLLAGILGAAYSQTLKASGGATPYTWSISSGNLPSDLILSSGGVISGIPKSVTTANFTVRVTSKDGYSSTKAFSLATSLETNKPTVTIVSPKAGQRWSNDVFTVTGKAADNAAVSNVWVRANSSGAWTPASGTTNWSASVSLVPGANTISAFATDVSGNYSTTSSVSMVYVQSATLTVAIYGSGTVTPNYNGVLLEIGKNYAMTAKAATGFAFTNWSDCGGNVITNKPALAITMASNLCFTANFVDIARPVLAVTNLKSGQRWSNQVITVKGKAGDNVAATNVFWQLNNGDWTAAQTANNWTNWTAANLTLTPGSNVFSAFAMDAAGNRSLTNTLRIVYVLSAPLTVTIAGQGTVTPNYSGALLEIGKSYSMMAKAGKGYAFLNWGGNASTSLAKLTFVMASNLSFTANFKDITRPVCVITAPKAKQRWSNEVFTVLGKATDNTAVDKVWYQLNDEGWNEAAFDSNHTNWSVPNLALAAGTNVVQTFATDAAGNISLTNTIKFLRIIVPDKAPDSLVGKVVSAPGPYGVTTLCFGTNTFSMSANKTNGHWGVGYYIYIKTGTNTAELTMNFSSPPMSSGEAPHIALTFTNWTGGFYTNLDDVTDNGAFGLKDTPTLAPASLESKNVAIKNSSGSVTVHYAASSYTQTGGDGQTGTYTYTPYSPIAGMLILNVTSPLSDNGAVIYGLVTFATSQTGTAMSAFYEPGSSVPKLRLSTFSVQ